MHRDHPTDQIVCPCDWGYTPLFKPALAQMNSYQHYTEISCLLMDSWSGALCKCCGLNSLEGRISLWYSPSLLSSKTHVLIFHDCDSITSEIQSREDVFAMKSIDKTWCCFRLPVVFHDVVKAVWSSPGKHIYSRYTDVRFDNKVKACESQAYQDPQ